LSTLVPAGEGRVFFRQLCVFGMGPEGFNRQVEWVTARNESWVCFAVI